MSETEQFDLDRTDYRILELLQREGRITNAELAERVNLSPSPCLRRLQRLEQIGVITGYAAHIDPKAVGLGLEAFVRVRLDKYDAASTADFIANVNQCDEVVACHALTGNMDYLLHVFVTNLDHFSRFLLERLLTVSGVADVNSSFVLKTVKQSRVLPTKTQP